MRRADVCRELGITRHTLAGIEKQDPTFPVFFPIAPGVEVVLRRDVEKWIKLKQLVTRMKAQQE